VNNQSCALTLNLPWEGRTSEEDLLR